MTFNNSTGFTQIETDTGISEVSPDKPNFKISGLGDVNTQASGRRINLNAPQAVGDSTTNLGLSFDSGTRQLRVVSADGTDLSPTNLGRVEIQREGTLNNSVVFEIDRPFRFIEGNLTGVNFGTLSGINWPEPMPFFLYLIANSDFSDFTFGICRHYGRASSSENTTIATRTSSQSNNYDFGFYLLDSLVGGSFVAPNKSNFALTSAVPLGFFTMTQNQANEWTVQPLSLEMGIDLNIQSKRFNFPTGVNGANAGTYFSVASGSVMGVSGASYVYSLSRTKCYCDIMFSSVGGPSNSQSQFLTAPYQTESFIETNGLYALSGQQLTSAGFSVKATSTSGHLYDLKISESMNFSNDNITSGSSMVINMRYPLLSRIP